MAVWQSKLQLKRKMCLLRHTAIFADTHSIIFLTASVHLLSCLVYLGRCIPSCLSHSTHFTTCACTVIGRLIFFAGGNKEAAKAQLFVLALYLASSARTHHTLARARVVLTVISVVVKFI
jgi:hypothetical protein